jgi:hypothetical protein
MVLASIIISLFLSQSVQAQKTRTYEDHELGLRVPYPSDWDIDLESGDKKSDQYLYAVEFYPGTWPLVYISIGVGPKTLEAEELASTLLESHMENNDYQNVRLKDRIPQINIGGKDFYSVSFEFDGHFGKECDEIFLTETNNTMYTFHLRRGGCELAFIPIFENMLRSAELSGFGNEGSSSGVAGLDNTDNLEVEEPISTEREFHLKTDVVVPDGFEGKVSYCIMDNCDNYHWPEEAFTGTKKELDELNGELSEPVSTTSKSDVELDVCAKLEPDRDPSNIMTKCTIAIYDGKSHEVQTKIDFTDMTGNDISSLGQNNQMEARPQEDNEGLGEIEDDVGDRQINRNINDEEDEDEESNDSDQNEGSGELDTIRQQPTQQQEPQPAVDPGGQSLHDACLKSGFSQEECNNHLLSGDQGGYCTTQELSVFDCAETQDPDPAFVYGNPEAASQQSEQQIENIE